MLKNGAIEPRKAHKGDAAWDLSSIEDITIYPDKIYKIDTGVCLNLPEGYCAKVLPRSGLSCKGIDVKLGLIDSNYTGSIHVIISTKQMFHIDKGMRIAQLTIEKLPEIDLVITDTLKETERNTNGFGSSGL